MNSEAVAAGRELLSGLDGVGAVLPKRSGRLGFAAVLLALGLHGAALASALILLPDAVEFDGFLAYEVDLVSLGPGSGSGHEEGAPAASCKVASPLPRQAQAAKPERQVPSSSIPSPAKLKSAAPGQEAAPAAQTPSASGDAASVPAAGYMKNDANEDARQQAAGNPAGLPQGQGQGLVGHGGYSLGQVERPPRLLRKVEPQYPLAARKRHVTGKVLVNISCGSRGTRPAPPGGRGTARRRLRARRNPGRIRLGVQSRHSRRTGRERLDASSHQFHSALISNNLKFLIRSCAGRRGPCFLLPASRRPPVGGCQRPSMFEITLSFDRKKPLPSIDQINFWMPEKA